MAIDPSDGRVTVLARFDGPLRPAAWDQRGDRIVLADGAEGSRLVVLDPADGSSFTLRDVVPAEHYVVGMS